MERFLSGIGTTPRRAFVVVGFIICAATIIFFSLRADDRDLTALSVAVAVVFGAVTSLQNAQMQRRDHTLSLLSAFSTADALAASDAQVSRLVARGVTVGGDLDEDDDCHVTHVLDYYEFICRSAQRKQIDALTVVALRGLAMAATYRVCQRYINDRRAIYGVDLYRAFESFVLDYRLVSGPRSSR